MSKKAGAEAADVIGLEKKSLKLILDANEDDNLLSVIRITESGEILINNKSLQ